MDDNGKNSEQKKEQKDEGMVRRMSKKITNMKKDADISTDTEEKGAISGIKNKVKQIFKKEKK
ncbi:hypothetical protein COBT_000782 [Conglomerata obtusa]